MYDVLPALFISIALSYFNFEEYFKNNSFRSFSLPLSNVDKSMLCKDTSSFVLLLWFIMCSSIICFVIFISSKDLEIRMACICEFFDGCFWNDLRKDREKDRPRPLDAPVTTNNVDILFFMLVISRK